jgi:two-component system, OmpR family, copper resistance phosphate regulon response regulator CusR
LFLLLYVSYRGKIKKRLKQIVISKNEKKDSSTRK